jgi:hypothetical protein
MLTPLYSPENGLIPAGVKARAAIAALAAEGRTKIGTVLMDPRDDCRAAFIGMLYYVTRLPKDLESQCSKHSIYTGLST